MRVPQTECKILKRCPAFTAVTIGKEDITVRLQPFLVQTVSVLRKETYVKLNPKQLLQEVYPRVRALGNCSVLSIPDIYLKWPYETLTRKGKSITRQRFVPIAAIAATYEKQATDGNVILVEEEIPAVFKDTYLLISNRVDAPEDAARAYTLHSRAMCN